MEIPAPISKGCREDAVFADGCTLLRVRTCLLCCFFRIISAWVLLREGPFLLPVSSLLRVCVSSRYSPFHAGGAGRLSSVACRIPLFLAAVGTTQGATFHDVLPNVFILSVLGGLPKMFLDILICLNLVARGKFYFENLEAVVAL